MSTSPTNAPAAPKTHVYRVTVQFGDCDPAGIVFFPNFNRWMDEASLAYFMAMGVPPWRVTAKTRNLHGTPLLEIQTRFIRSATYGESLEVHTSIVEWARKTFKQQHRVMRGEELICEGTEVRTFIERDPQNWDRIRSVPIPEDIKALCS